MIIGCHICGYFTNNKFSLKKHVESQKHFSKSNLKWNSLIQRYSKHTLLDTRINQLSFLRKIDTCDMSTQTNDEDFYQKYLELESNYYKSESYYDADIDMNNNNTTTITSTVKRKRTRQYSNRIKKNTSISKKKKGTTSLAKGWMICLCIMLVYLIKKRVNNSIELYNNDVVVSNDKKKDTKKKYFPPIVFRKLWKDELNKMDNRKYLS